MDDETNPYTKKVEAYRLRAYASLVACIAVGYGAAVLPGQIIYSCRSKEKNENIDAPLNPAIQSESPLKAQLGVAEAQTLKNYRGLLGALVLDGSVRVDHPAFEKYGIYPSVEQLPDGRKHVGIVETPGLGQPLEVVEP